MKNIKNLLEICYHGNDTLLLEGGHGIGKSEMVAQWAHDNDFYCEVLFLSTQEPGDLIGLPKTITLNETEVTTWAKPVWLQRVEDAMRNGKQAVLFLDEFNRASLDVRQAMLELVLNKRLHEHKLPKLNNKNVLIVAAINSASDYQVETLDTALLDRFLHYEVSVDAGYWFEYAKSNQINKKILGYLAKTPEQLFYPVENQQIFPTPRSWTKLSEIIKNNDLSKYSKDVVTQIFSGKLGTLIGAQFLNYYYNEDDLITFEIIEEFISEQRQKTNDFDILVKNLKEDILQNLTHTWTLSLCKDYLNFYEHKDNNENMHIFLNAINLEMFTAFIMEVKEESQTTLQVLMENDKTFALLDKITPLMSNE